MTEFSRELIFGKRPIRRTDRKPGESEWYYLDPRGASTFSDMKKIDVPTENTPNPYANEIQNYLYKNDEYNYRELYGDTPPPVPQPSTQPATQPTAQPVTLENKGFGFQSNDGQTTFANTTNDAFGQQNNTFGTNTSFGSQQNTIQNQTPTPWNAVNNSQQQSVTKQNNNLKPLYWESEEDGKKVYENVVDKEGKFTQPIQQSDLYQLSAIKALINILNNFYKLSPLKITDKFKHAYINCNASQYGQGGEDVARLVSNLREWDDVRTGSNTLDSSNGDQYANKIGRLLGGKYPSEDCNELVEKYIKRFY